MNGDETAASGVRMIRWRYRLAVGAAIAATAAMGPATPYASASAPPEPTYGSATVDGSPGEWSGADAFGVLNSNDPPYRSLASASLRYDCDTGVLFVYVAADAGVVLQTIDPAEDYVRLGSAGKIVDGLSSSFAWVGRSGDTATGWEASAAVAEGAYPAQLRIHAKVPDDSSDGYEVIDLVPRYSDLTIACPATVTSTSTSSTTSTTSEVESAGSSSTSTSVPEDAVVKPAQVEKASPADPVTPASGSAELTG
jgi:hypothetical protein